MKRSLFPTPVLAAAQLTAAALIALLYAPTLSYFAHRWLTESVYRHCWLVIPVIAWLLWRRRWELRQLPRSPSYTGLAIIFIGLLIYILGARAGVRMLIGLSMPVVIAGLCWAWLGTAIAKATAIPLLLLFFLIPLPRHALGLVAMPMQVFSAKATAVLARASGLDVSLQGIQIDMGGFGFVVAQECSGLNSLMALLFVGGVMLELSKTTLLRKLLTWSLASFIVIIANVFRLLTVLWVAKFVSPAFALDSLVHGTSDLVIYVAALSLMALAVATAEKLPPLPRLLKAAQSRGRQMPPFILSRLTSNEGRAVGRGGVP